MIVKSRKQTVFLVVPTIRSLGFLSAWEGLLRDCHLIIIEDNPVKQIYVPKEGFRSTHHYSWGDIKKDFGKDEWIFSRRNAGIRSYGFWKAHQLGADIIITLDDDCYPVDSDFIVRHAINLSLRAPDGWSTTFPHPDFLYMRGFPYDVRNKHPVVISHGLWSNKMDLDAKTQLLHPDVSIHAYPPNALVCSKRVLFSHELYEPRVPTGSSSPHVFSSHGERSRR